MPDIKTYDELREAIQNKIFKKETYYDLILLFSADIIEDTRNRPKYKVAKALNMSSPDFSYSLRLLEAYQRTLHLPQQTPDSLSIETRYVK